MVVARHLRHGVALDRFVAQDDPGGVDLLGQPPAAMVDEAGVVIPGDPYPVDAFGH